ncbi:permease prefix domain 1-containing protein [Microbacterium pseudoresistens]|uniref:Uncharacterized protein n=1 Tax=Microbacterium pseudoresistens TaxID=640634 RepID=A0A7Y9ETD6_9MICO|nr:permease prefix domain 1-containing protein [Microbacterium pseudoresistens]NYD53501.1 hypothetical protein [Microbacterium pseudoresistens]
MTATTLTERYIAATVRSLPAALQEDVRTELTASISDAVEARTTQGEPAEQAERAALVELGDPSALAADYADRPLHLIGPRFYLTWSRLLRLLLWIVPVCAAAGVTIANLIADKPVGEIIGQIVVVGITSIVHVAFWTTLVFFILERSGATDVTAAWDPDQLPEPQETGAGRGDLVASLVFLGLMAAALLWDRFVGFVLVARDHVDVGVGLGAQTTAIPMLNPELWPWWLGGALVLIAAEAALAIAVYANRGWTRAFAAINTLLAVVFAAGTLVLLAAGRLLSPAFLDFTLGRSDVPDEVARILAVLLGIVVVGVAVWDAIDGWRKARRAGRS